jgi:hypothetical protein
MHFSPGITDANIRLEFRRAKGPPMMNAARRRFLAPAGAYSLIADAMRTEGLVKNDSGEVGLGRDLMTV